jgi:hypothetical protein
MGPIGRGDHQTLELSPHTHARCLTSTGFAFTMYHGLHRQEHQGRCFGSVHDFDNPSLGRLIRFDPTTIRSCYSSTCGRHTGNNTSVKSTTITTEYRKYGLSTHSFSFVSSRPVLPSDRMGLRGKSLHFNTTVSTAHQTSSSSIGSAGSIARIDHDEKYYRATAAVPSKPWLCSFSLEWHST